MHGYAFKEKFNNHASREIIKKLDSNKKGIYA